MDANSEHLFKCKVELQNLKRENERCVQKNADLIVENSRLRMELATQSRDIDLIRSYGKQVSVVSNRIQSAIRDLLPELVPSNKIIAVINQSQLTGDLTQRQTSERSNQLEHHDEQNVDDDETDEQNQSSEHTASGESSANIAKDDTKPDATSTASPEINDVAQVDSLQENGPSVQNSPVESNVASEQETTDGDENANDVAEMHYNLEGLETAIEESAVVPGIDYAHFTIADLDYELELASNDAATQEVAIVENPVISPKTPRIMLQRVDKDEKLDTMVPIASDAVVNTPKMAAKENAMNSEHRRSENRRKVTFSTPLQVSHDAGNNRVRNDSPSTPRNRKSKRKVDLDDGNNEPKQMRLTRSMLKIKDAVDDENQSQTPRRSDRKTVRFGLDAEQPNKNDNGERMVANKISHRRKTMI